MTLPKVEVGQTWRRVDGTTVLIEHAGPFGFFAAGTYYTGGQHNDRYHSPGGNPLLDLVTLVQPLEEVYEEGLAVFGEKAEPVATGLQPLAKGQRWRRRDGKEVVVEWDEQEDCSYVDGYFYFYNDDDKGEVARRLTGCHVAPCATEGYDLIEYLGMVDDSTTVLSVPVAAEDTPEEPCPHRLETFGYSDGVFCGLDEDGGAWYREKNLPACWGWTKLPSLPSE